MCLHEYDISALPFHHNILITLILLVILILIRVPVLQKKYLRITYADPYVKHREIDWEARWNEARAALKSAQSAEGGDEEEDEDESLL